MKSVAIIGAGIAGLTAAYRLKQQGVPVVIYEAGSRVGGMIHTVQKEGYTVECGPSMIMETSPEPGKLVGDLGLNGSRLLPDIRAKRNYIVRGNTPIVLPKTPLDFFTTPLFSHQAKLRLLGEPFIERGNTAENLAEFVLRRLGREFLDYAINPFVGGVYAGDPHKLSVEHAFPKLHAVERVYGSLLTGQFLGSWQRRCRGEKTIASAARFSFPDGLQTLVRALQNELRTAIRLHAPVRVISRKNRGWEVEIDHCDQPTLHSAIVLAAPAHRLAAIALQGHRSISLAALGRIPYPPLAVVALGFRREEVEHPLDGFGMLVPEVEQAHILGTTFSSTVFPGRAPEGKVLLTSFLGGSRQPGLAVRTPQLKKGLVLKDLRRFLGVRCRPVFEHQTLVPHSIPQYQADYGHHKELMSSMENDLPGLYFAGNYRNGISLGHSIVSGTNVAQRVNEFLQGAEETQEAAILG